MLLCHCAAQSKQLGATAIPFALHTTLLIVIVAVFKMPLGIPGTARHGPDRQHTPKLTLFEVGMQMFSMPTPSTAIAESCVIAVRLCNRQFAGLARLPFSLRSL
jgi:hypothetical protein